VLGIYTLAFSLLAPVTSEPEFPPGRAEMRLHEAYVELFERHYPDVYPRRELKSLRSRIEREREKAIEDAKSLEERWKKELSDARDDLEELNKASSFDAPGPAGRRAKLHIDIAALERTIQAKSKEREHTIPATFEAQLTKLWLIEHWPERREEIAHRIEQGDARKRNHGDAEDIGYRLLAKDQEKDIETGTQAARQVVAGGWLPPELQDSEIQGYVRGLGARIAAHSDLKVPLRVTVLGSTEPKVVALPGGFLYVTSGVIAAANTESEFAGVLSREIARIAARHATRSSKLKWVSRIFMPVTQIATGLFAGSGINPAASYGINYGAQGLAGLMDRVLDGTDERNQKEADQLGIQYAWKAGFDPKGFIAFLDSAARREGGESFVSSEPALPKRLLNLYSEIQYLPAQENPIVDSAEFRRIRRRVIFQETDPTPE
jgi:hypothetical protein